MKLNGGDVIFVDGQYRQIDGREHLLISKPLSIAAGDSSVDLNNETTPQPNNMYDLERFGFDEDDGLTQVTLQLQYPKGTNRFTPQRSVLPWDAKLTPRLQNAVLGILETELIASNPNFITVLAHNDTVGALGIKVVFDGWWYLYRIITADQAAKQAAAGFKVVNMQQLASAV